MKTVCHYIVPLSLYLLLLCLAGCSGCSRSGSHQPRRPRHNRDTVAATPRPTPEPVLKQIGDGPTEVAMEKRNGVYTIPVTVNGRSMSFILDTGASLISMSTTEAELLFRRGTIGPRDIIGRSQFQDANGDISPGAIIRLRSVQIGDRVLENVNANVVGNAKAPLLLGQSALSKFGRISLDYRRNVVTFE